MGRWCNFLVPLPEFLLLEGLEELLAHSVKGLRSVKKQSLPANEEAAACRSYLLNLLSTLDHMSHTSHMFEMRALQTVLREILTDMLTHIEARNNKKCIHR